MRHALIFAFFILLVIAYGPVVNGQACGPQGDGGYILCTQIPGFPTTISAQGGIAEYVRAIYRYALGVGGIVVFILIIYGGIMYALSGGTPGKQNEARDIIFQAFWGLALLLGSYLILYTVNPELVTLKSIEADQIAKRLEIEPLNLVTQKAAEQAATANNDFNNQAAELLTFLQTRRDLLEGKREPTPAEYEIINETAKYLEGKYNSDIVLLNSEIAVFEKRVDIYRTSSARNYIKGKVVNKEDLEFEALGAQDMVNLIKLRQTKDRTLNNFNGLEGSRRLDVLREELLKIRR